MDENCVLCAFQKKCSEDDLFLFAATPILREIVDSHLRAIGADFSFEQELFRLATDHDRVVRELSQRLADSERAGIRLTRDRGAASIGAPLLDQWNKQVDTSWLDLAIRQDAFTTHFQPIVDTAVQQVFAHECLIRLFSGRAYTGGEIMDAVISRGNVHLFDSYARRLSIRNAALQHSHDAKIFVNFMPSSIYDPAFCMKSTLEELSETSLRPTDIVFEVVESDLIKDVRHLRKICDFYREQNFGFALDDVGTGSNSFQMIAEMKPDFIKIDKSLVSRMSEPMFNAAVGKLGEFADQFGLRVIAEGVENVETFRQLRLLGIDLMQGYFFARPGPRMVDCPNLQLLTSAPSGSGVTLTGGFGPAPADP